MKRIVVACGNGVATSQALAYKINRMLEKENVLDAKVEAVNLRSLESELRGAIAYVEISRSNREYEIPKIDGLAFLSGDNKETEFKKLLEIIKKGEIPLQNY